MYHWNEKGVLVLGLTLQVIFPTLLGMTKKRVVYSILLVVFVFAVFGFLIIKNQADRVKEITVTLKLPDNIMNPVLKEIKHYDTITPKVDITISNENIQATDDIEVYILDSTYQMEDRFKYLESFYWFGQSWNLTINRELLNELGLEIPKITAINELELLMEDVARKEIAPVSIGNSHLWPLSIWAQHIEIALGNDPELVPYTDSWTVLKRWYDKGYFLEERWNKGWANGINGVSDRDAAITLMSGRMITSIPREKQSSLYHINFPKGERDENWIVGTGYVLFYKNSAEYEYVQKLIDYLTSPAVTERLTKDTKILFRSESDNKIANFYSSWEKLANDNDMREYNRQLDRFVTE